MALHHKVLAWRRVPTDNSNLGESARATEPVVMQAIFSLSTNPVTSSPDPEAQVCMYLQLKSYGLYA